MKTNEVTILDFGSRKITCMVAQGTTNNDFVISATGQCLYDGFEDGVFYEPSKLKSCVEFAISQVEQRLGKKIKSIVVGVPGEFSVVATSEGGSVFRSKKKIDENDLQELIQKADIFRNIGNRVLIEKNSIYYVLDNLTKTYNPVGQIAQKISGYFCFSFASKYFTNMVSGVLKSLGVTDVKYVNTCLNEAIYLASFVNADNKAMFFDIGHITTNIMVSEGAGLVFQYTFPLGSAYIASDLCQVLNIGFERALQLLNKINLNLEFAEKDSYVLSDAVLVPAELSNNVVKARIAEFADYIKKSFAHCDKQIDRNIDIYLTGGALSYIKGADTYLSSMLNKEVKLFDFNSLQNNKNEYASCYGLISKALKMAPKKRRFWGF